MTNGRLNLTDNLRARDAGIYTCKGINAAGEGTATFRLIVNGKLSQVMLNNYFIRLEQLFTSNTCIYMYMDFFLSLSS